jgi:hypothetical protein
MKPSLPYILFSAAGTLGTGVAPHLLAAPYAIGHVGTIGLLMIFAAQESDRQVETLFVENAALADLFRDALALPLPDAVRAAIDTVLAEPDPGLRVGPLEAANEAKREVLISLHAAVETLEGDAARALESQIWTILLAGAEARALMLPVL